MSKPHRMPRVFVALRTPVAGCPWGHRRREVACVAADPSELFTKESCGCDLEVFVYACDRRFTTRPNGKRKP